MNKVAILARPSVKYDIIMLERIVGGEKQAIQLNVESEFSEIEFNVFENTRRAPAKQRRLAFCAAKLKVLGVFFQMPGNLPHILCEDTSCSFFPSG